MLEGVDRRDVERGLVGAQAAHLVRRDRAAGERLAEVVGLDRAVVREVVHPGPRRAHGGAEALCGLEAVAHVVAAGEEDVLDALDLVRHGDRVEEQLQLRQPVRAHLDAEVRMGRFPVPNSGGDFLHGRILQQIVQLAGISPDTTTGVLTPSRASSGWRERGNRCGLLAAGANRPG